MTATVPKNQPIGRKLARGAVRTALVGVTLAQGNPLGALAYSMPQTVGATVLASRLNAGRRSRPPSKARRPPRAPPR
ncbi:hypothetical protein [Streptomyces sp. NBC_01353]|uniref:hypothetical protein n=1 Tax=Streptomyces sp. NBC_01353 TaxID=2903835 RepID=UPI002E322391|nr:hypothetical protein [Streptomyces sp. NBC_01353]